MASPVMQILGSCKSWGKAMGEPNRSEIVVAFGPEKLGWGSWNWIGADLRDALANVYATRDFSAWDNPNADVVVVVKHMPPKDWLRNCGRRSAVIYCPVDYYGAAAEIDADGPELRNFRRIVIHCERLRRYFEPYATVEYLDHHVKFAAPLRDSYRETGNILWVGVRSNLPAFVDWVNNHPLPAPLDVLTNLETPNRPPTAAGLGFRDASSVRIYDWNPHVQAQLTSVARAVIDIKADDFRSRNKPPAKGLDVIASGVPLAMNAGSSTVEHLSRIGFEIASPLEPARWLSREYWEETRQIGSALRELLSLRFIAKRLRRMIDEVQCG